MCRFENASGDGSTPGGGVMPMKSARRLACYNQDVAASGLPGADLIEEGLADFGRGVESIASLVVSVGAPRLRVLGYAVPQPHPEPEHHLYARLQAEYADAAHSRYNALIRRLVSFERAAACAR